MTLFRRIFLSADEPRLRAGWRLLLHSIFFGVSLSLLTLAVVMVVWNNGDLFATGLPLDATIELIAILLATYVARKVLDRRSFASLGFSLDSNTVKDLVVGFWIPGLLMGLIFVTELSLGWLTIDSFAWETMAVESWLGILLQGLLLFTLVGVSEELLSRGYQLQNISEGLNLTWGVLISSSIFAVLHLANPSSSLFSSLGIFAAGLFLAYGWIRTGKLWLPIGLHLGWNLFEGTVFGFPVSGLKIEALINQTPSGPMLITGGGFGPEAGLIVLPAMLLGVFIISIYTRHRNFQA
jgi:membrane protease YdiL (CAAX protease family)